MFDVIILSIVQGVTEFIPVSSSAHLILVSEYFDFNNGSLLLDINLHFGSLLAVIIYFKKDLFKFINNKKLFLKIILSSLPVILVGFILIKLDLIKIFRNFKVIGWMTIIFGFVLYFTDKADINREINKDLRLKSALLIGGFQVLSLIPGVSRSGITISAARMLKFKREDAVKISFLLRPTVSFTLKIFNFSG